MLSLLAPMDTRRYKRKGGLVSAFLDQVTLVFIHLSDFASYSIKYLHLEYATYYYYIIYLQ
jgi:hypothetical protein